MPRDTDPPTGRDLHAVVIGIGNPYRADDGFGPAVTKRLRGRVPAGVAVVDAEGDAASIMDAWRGYDVVVIVDALFGIADPGRVHRLDPLAAPLPRELFRCSTHAVGLSEAVELARVLGHLPRRMLVFGAEGKRFDAGTAMSSEVSDAVNDVVGRILDELSAQQPGRPA